MAQTTDPNVPNDRGAASGMPFNPVVIRRSVFTQTATIANAATTSDAMSQDGGALAGFVMPAAFTGTSVTFTVSGDGVTYQALYDETNTLVSVTVAASRSYAAPAALAAWPQFKIVSGSAEGAQRLILCVFKA